MKNETIFLYYFLTIYFFNLFYLTGKICTQNWHWIHNLSTSLVGSLFLKQKILKKTLEKDIEDIGYNSVFFLIKKKVLFVFLLFIELNLNIDGIREESNIWIA
mgnify:CR=1 FL=1